MFKTKHTASILKFLCLLTFILTPSEVLAETSFFNESWFKAVVSIEIDIPEQNFNQPVGTGFLVNTPKGNIALVTAKHVIFDNVTKIKREHLAYRINFKNKPSKIMSEDLFVKKAGAWFKSEKTDVAVHFFPSVRDSALTYIHHDNFLSISKIKAGAPALIMGFPLGLRSKTYTEPIVRKAIVAGKSSDAVLMDGFTFPGNSGGPVVYYPSSSFFTVGSKVDKHLKQQQLLGIVSGYIPYNDICESKQTKKARIIFEENSGLTKIIPTDEILKIMASPEFKAIDTIN